MSRAAPAVLPDAAWLCEPPLADVLRVLNAPGIETRVVGGAVRNVLLGVPIGDVDLATTGEPDAVAGLAEAAGMKAVPTGIAHGTITVVAQGRPFEVTTLRHDVEGHGRHATVAFGAGWEEDARRRDFTMNALYADRDGRLHDPVGGYADILARRVRFIGDAEQRIREDYLRILRFFRLHAQYGTGAPDPAGLGAAIRLRAGLLSLSGERLRQETLRLLAAPGAVATVTAAAECGILGMVIGGVPYLVGFGRLAAIEAESGAAADPVLRLAAVGVTVREDALRVAGRLRLSNADRRRLAEIAEGWRAMRPGAGDGALKTMLYRTGPQTFRDRALVAFARSGAAAGDERWTRLVTLPDRWTAPAFPVKGADLRALGVAAGPDIGRLLARLERDWVAGGFAGGRDALLETAKALIEKPLPGT